MFVVRSINSLDVSALWDREGGRYEGSMKRGNNEDQFRRDSEGSDNIFLCIKLDHKQAQKNV